jgi:branched-chain amino acid transport system permease protein
MTTAEAPVPGPGAARWRALGVGRKDAQRLVGCLVVGIVLALMTGKSGSTTAPTSGFTGTLGRPRVVIFLAIGLVIWLAITVWDRNLGGVRERSRALADTSGQFSESRRVRYPAYLLLLVAAIVIPPTLLSAFWQRAAVDDIAIYVLLALGLNVVVGFAGLLDLGYIAFYAIGAYVAAYFAGALPVQPPFHLNLFFVFPIAVIAAMFSGVILGAPTLRLRGDYLAIVTLGFGEIIEIVANNMNSVTGGPIGTKPLPHFAINLFGIHYHWTLSSLPYYYLLLTIIVLVLIAFAKLEDSRVGRAWVAIREDEVAAEACGINTLKYKVMAFAIGASTAGFAGVVFAGRNNFFDPPVFSVQVSIFVLVLVIFGGMGSMVGVVVGAVFLTFLQQKLRDYIQPQDLYIYIGFLLVVMMIFRPQGLLPSRRRARELGMAEAGVGGADAMGAPGSAP